MPGIKKKTTIYTLIAAAAAELISLPFLGANILFPYGLALGVCAAIINLNVISVSVERAVASGRKAPVTLGFLIRILLYAGAFCLAVLTSGLSALGAAVGFLLPRLVMYIFFGFLPWFKQKTGREPKPVYAPDTHSNIFIKEPLHVLYNRGRAFITHRHFKKVRVVESEYGNGNKNRNKTKAEKA